MTVRRFRLELEGLGSLIGLVFDDGEHEREAFLAGRRNLAGPAETTAACPESGQPCPVGRPSFDPTIARAIAALGEALNATEGVSAKARLVLRHLAQRGIAPDLIPTSRTVENYFAKRARKNSGKKSRKNSASATIVRNPAMTDT